MSDVLSIPKLTLIVTTRCNMKCRLCCEYIPQNKPFADMTLDEERAILDAAFKVVDHVDILHLSGGGEPFLHPRLGEMIDLAFEYGEYFDRLMVFTNSTVPVSEKLLEALIRHRDRVVVHASDYGLTPQRTQQVYALLQKNDINLRVIKYYGDDQDFGGWVDFGEFSPHGRTPEELERVFQNCAITRDMCGNWRTRDGVLHWCSRSQRGSELGLIPVDERDCVDLLDAGLPRDAKRDKIRRIMQAPYLSACDWCSGDQGTDDASKRFAAAEQMDG